MRSRIVGIRDQEYRCKQALEWGYGTMPKGYGRLQRRLLYELHLAGRPVLPSALIPGRSGFEKRQALRRLAADGIVREVQPDRWALNGPWREMRNEPLEVRKAT